MIDNSRPLKPAVRGQGVTAVLGPTNTGKTTLAIERMLASPSGLIGLPLRLLAREVYSRLVARAGPEAVALVTGEEKIKPDGARYWVATVEAMPLALDVSFLAIDEIQIAADLERGHVFTDRILNRRGRDETMLLGAATMRPLVEKLLPGAAIVTRPRFSELHFAGEKKITRLPRRSAIVAFSADEVYAIAELIRRQRGGAAVVMGALSPRTRNAQVELYQNGDVDYLIATDAIGMGLNLDVEHVAFAADRKFDGYQFRRLNPTEFAQIAGRAGRSNRDGTFGTTGRCPAFEQDLVEALEGHAFEPVKVLQWRNTALDFGSIDRLRESLDIVPSEPCLTRSPLAEDQRVLESALRDEDVRARAVGRAAVERLWDACMLPDYRKISPAAHAELVISIFGFLSSRSGRVPSDWIAERVKLADRVDGDIDTLSTRIAHIRTWTFAASRLDWVDDPVRWQAETRAVEDKLSDALHERLTQRFVDRRTSVLMRRLRENTMLEAEITKAGDVMVEGQHVGRLEGFRFAPDPQAGDGEAGRALRAAATKALAGEIEKRADKLNLSADDTFILSMDGTIRWHGEAVAKLSAGEKTLAPRVRLIADEQLTGPPRDLVQARLDLWVTAHIEKLLGPVSALEKAEELHGLARGVAFQLVEALGVLDRQKVAQDVKQLDQDARAALRKLGVRFGAYHIFLPATLKPAPRALALQLWLLKTGEIDDKALADLPALASSGRTSIAIDPAIQKDHYRLVGFRALGTRAVRVDILERLADLIRPVLAWKPGAPQPEPAGHYPGGGFVATVAMTSLVGCSGEDFAGILKGLGYRVEKKPAPPKHAPVPVAATTPDAAAGDTGKAPVDAEVDVTPVEHAAPIETSAKPMAEAPVESAPIEDTVVAPEAEETATAEAAPAAESSVAKTLAAETIPETPAETVLIDVWRPGGRMDGERGPRRDQQRRHHGKPRPSADPNPQPRPLLEGQGRYRQSRPPVDPNPQPRPLLDADGRPRGPRPEGQRRDDRKFGDRLKRDGEGPRDKDRRDSRPSRRDLDRDGRGERQRIWSSEDPAGERPGEGGQRPPRREKQPDPNSPFAKLAALKDSLGKK